MVRSRIPVRELPVGVGVPRVVVQRMNGTAPGTPPADHTHDFFALAYVTAADPDAGTGPGDLHVMAPGDVVGARAFGISDRALASVRGWTVMFDADLLGAQPATSPTAWGSHPLLAPFVGARATATGHARLVVPPPARATWDARVAALHAELQGRRAGHHAAAGAHLTLLLVEVARLVDGVAGGVATDLRRSHEPLLGEVFDVIERRFAGPLSLRDVAASVGMSAGHLTTRVRERTGRTVLEWIVERRMLEARRLLATTDRPVGVIAAAVGITDPGYFARVFRRAHGVSPAAWRGRTP